jgi:S-DNA-T family DNA segregation ATPase FtsK/SpoIIIE
MLAGRNYSGGAPVDDVLNLDELAHVLAVGMTGSGKSTLLRMMIGSLALNTSPDALRLFIVDPKAEDFLPFKRLPHCEMFAGRREIAQAIAQVRATLAERQDIEGRFNGPRVVLFLDELSQVKDPNAIRQLNDLMAVGRSKKINVILATQYPTKDVIGKVDLSNVGVRFVGQVATNKEAYVASGRGETFAHLLPGKGAFLRVEGTGGSRPRTRFRQNRLFQARHEAYTQTRRWSNRARIRCGSISCVSSGTSR